LYQHQRSFIISPIPHKLSITVVSISKAFTSFYHHYWRFQGITEINFTTSSKEHRSYPRHPHSSTRTYKMSYQQRRGNRNTSSPSSSSTSRQNKVMAQPIQHIPFVSTNTLTRGPLSIRSLNSTAHHILFALTISPQSTGFPIMSNTIIAATFHVTQGAVRFQSCAENSTSVPLDDIDATKGATISAPPNSFYGISNPFEEDAEVLCVYSPGGWAHCLEEWASFHGDWESEEAKTVMRKCGTVFLGDEVKGDAEGEDDDELDFNPQLRCMA
jgi:hypothetical protein